MLNSFLDFLVAHPWMRRLVYGIAFTCSAIAGYLGNKHVW
jgi:hypothetical protein